MQDTHKKGSYVNTEHLRQNLVRVPFTTSGQKVGRSSLIPEPQMLQLWYEVPYILTCTNLLTQAHRCLVYKHSATTDVTCSMKSEKLFIGAEIGTSQQNIHKHWLINNNYTTIYNVL